MDLKKLISVVFEHPIIWDKRLDLHACRTAVAQEWLEIATEMDYEVPLLRKKWKYLRDQFAVEWAKTLNTKPGDEPPRWRYFQSLQFLKEVTSQRNLKELQNSSTANDSAAGSSCELSDDDSHLSTQDSIAVSTSTNKAEPGFETPNLPIFSNQAFNKRKRKWEACEEYQRQCLGKEGVKWGNLKNTPKEISEYDDEATLFVKSLLPHMRKIPEHKMLIFRRRIESLVEEFAYPQSSMSETRSTSVDSSHQNLDQVQPSSNEISIEKNTIVKQELLHF